MIILGIDPGTNVTGYGVIKYERNTFSRITSGTINLSSSQPIPLRLKVIHKELNKIIKNYSPDEFAIETAFYGKNVQSAMKIGYARGVSILSATLNNVPVSEYTPREVKKSVVGKGSATKEQVSFMIKSLLVIGQEKIKTDETDALAIALCHAFRLKSNKTKNMSWKQFAKKFPERVLID